MNVLCGEIIFFENTDYNGWPGRSMNVSLSVENECKDLRELNDLSSSVKLLDSAQSVLLFQDYGCTGPMLRVTSLSSCNCNCR